MLPQGAPAVCSVGTARLLNYTSSLCQHGDDFLQHSLLTAGKAAALPALIQMPAQTLLAPGNRPCNSKQPQQSQIMHARRCQTLQPHGQQLPTWQRVT